MNIHVNQITRCAGQNHFTIEVVVGGQTHQVEATRQDMDLDFATVAEAKEAVKARCRSAIKEANASTWAQIQTALNNKDFKL